MTKGNANESKAKMEVNEEEMASAKQLGDLIKGAGFGGFGGANEEFLASLPQAVKRRIRALKKLQLDGIRLEADFYKKVHELEAQFAPEFQKLHDKRRDVVAGSYEPTDAEADFPMVHGLPEEDLKLQDGDSTETDDGPTKPVIGVPQFWLQVLKNFDNVAEMIQEHDEPILQHLIDIECLVQVEPPGFTLVFRFSPNDFFTNTEIKKHYTLKLDEDKEEPFEYDGPMVTSCVGAKIDWKDGKNVTTKLIKKKQKHKHTGGTRFVTKQVKNDSFFNFFDPPEHTADSEDDLDDDTRALLRADFEIGQAIRDRIIPRAVLFYTGEAGEDDDFDEDADDEEDEDDDDENGEDSENDE